MVGRAIWRKLLSAGYSNLIGQISKELDLRIQLKTEDIRANESLVTGVEEIVWSDLKLLS